MKRSFSYVFNDKKYRSNSTKIKDLTESKTVRLSLSNYISNNDNINKKISKIKQSINSYKIINLKHSNELINNTKKYFSKKSLIFSLREDLEYHKKINNNYNAYQRYTNDLCRIFKKNFEEIYIYKGNLSNELKDFIILLEAYEDTKEKLIGFLVVTMIFTLVILILSAILLNKVEVLFKNIAKKDTPFIKENAGIIRKIGYYMIAITIISAIESVLSTALIGGARISKTGIGFSLMTILIIFAAARLFDYGNGLEEGNQEKIDGNITE